MKTVLKLWLRAKKQSNSLWKACLSPQNVRSADLCLFAVQEAANETERVLTTAKATRDFSQLVCRFSECSGDKITPDSTENRVFCYVTLFQNQRCIVIVNTVVTCSIFQHIKKVSLCTVRIFEVNLFKNRSDSFKESDE